MITPNHILVFFALALGGLGVVFFLFNKKLKQKKNHSENKKKYQNLVLQLESIQKQLNHINQSLHLVKNTLIIEHMEKCVGFMHTLTEAITHIHPKDLQQTSLNSALILARDCQNQVFAAQHMLDQYFGRQTSAKPHYVGNGEIAKAGCYFCSRPFINFKAKEVKVKIENNIKNVNCCEICYINLKNTKKVRVLHFVKNGKEVHWSEHSEYKPNQEFWHINQKENILNKTQEASLLPFLTSEEKPHE